MAAAKKKQWKEWPGKRAAEEALFYPRAEESWCCLDTVWWILDRTNISIGIPGIKAGDVPAGRRVAGSWDGLVMYENDDVRPGIIVARRIERIYHVRLEKGEVHEGYPDYCDHHECLAERVMAE